MELVSSYKASEDVMSHLEREFANGNVPLEQMLKLTRKIEEERFMSKVMIKKKMGKSK